jgi:hypothetical protein
MAHLIPSNGGSRFVLFSHDFLNLIQIKRVEPPLHPAKGWVFLRCMDTEIEAYSIKEGALFVNKVQVEDAQFIQVLGLLDNG